MKIFCCQYISIGEMSEVTWESQVTNFNSHYIENMTTKQISNIIKPVHIGKRNWIGNRSPNMPGTYLPNNIIVTSNSLLNKDYLLLGIKESSLLGGMPARIIKQQVRIYSHKDEATIKEYFNRNDCEIVPNEVLTETEFYG